MKYGYSIWNLKENRLAGVIACDEETWPFSDNASLENYSIIHCYVGPEPECQKSLEIDRGVESGAHEIANLVF